MSTTEQPKYYRFSFKGIKLDPYRVLQVYGITHPAQQHAIKKLLRAGGSVKSLVQDIDEVILSLNRWKEMLNEETKDIAPGTTAPVEGGQPHESADGHRPQQPGRYSRIAQTLRSGKEKAARVQPNRRGRSRVRPRSEVEVPNSVSDSATS